MFFRLVRRCAFIMIVFSVIAAFITAVSSSAHAAPRAAVLTAAVCEAPKFEPNVLADFDDSPTSGVTGDEYWSEFRSTMTKMTKAFGTLAGVGIYEDGTVWTSYRDTNDVVLQWQDIVALTSSPHGVLGLKSDGTVVDGPHWRSASNTFDPDVSTWTDIAAIADANDAAFGVKRDGTVVYALSPTHLGEAYAPRVSTWTDVRSIAVNGSAVYGLRKDGTMLVTGLDSRNWTPSETLSSWTGIQSIAATTMAEKTVVFGVKSDGTVLVGGYGEGDFSEVSSWSDITSVTAYYGTVVGLKSDGTVVYFSADGTVFDDVGSWSGITAIGMNDRVVYGLTRPMTTSSSSTVASCVADPAPPADEPTDDTPPADEDCVSSDGSSFTDGCLPPGASWTCPVDDYENTTSRADWLAILQTPGFRDDWLADLDLVGADLEAATKEFVKSLSACLQRLTTPPITKIPKSGGDPAAPWLGLAGLSVLVAAGATGVVVARRRSRDSHV